MAGLGRAPPTRPSRRRPQACAAARPTVGIRRRSRPQAALGHVRPRLCGCGCRLRSQPMLLPAAVATDAD
eukprot:4358673-Prymnesium_polylepis.1